MSNETEKIIMDLEKEAISVEEGAETVLLTATLLTSVEYVCLIPPPDRPDDCCCIYGDISVTDDLNKPAVSLFSRPSNDPQIIDFTDPDFCHLDLTDPHSFDRALIGNSYNYVNFDLHEKKNVRIFDRMNGEEEEEEEEHESSEEEDPDEAIADMKAVKFRASYDMTNIIDVEGNYGFGFEVRHAAIFGVRVQVEVKINRQIEIETGIAKSICGCILACQYFGYPAGNKTEIRLYSATRHEPTRVRVGEPIPLDRHTVVAPIAGGWLSIGLALWSGDINRGEYTEELVQKNEIADEVVHFSIMPNDKDEWTFLTNKQRTHTKQVRDGLFSVSITFVD